MPSCTIITWQPHCPRPGRWDTLWRTLPHVLLERPLGGSWDLLLDGLPTCRIGDSQLAVVPAGWRHRLRKAASDADMTSSWCYLRWGDDGAGAWPVPSRPLILSGPDAALIDALGPGDGTLRSTARRAEAAWRILAGVAGLDAAPVPPRDPRVRDLIAWMQANLHLTIGRDDLAAQAGCSATRLHDLCVAGAGLAPMRLLARLRIARAQELLLGSELPLGAIAGRCGYSSAFWFSRAFRRACGQTASAYRTAHRAG